MIKQYKLQKQQRQHPQIIDQRIQRIRQQLTKLNVIISDTNCQFQINNNISINNQFIVIKIICKPFIGLYQGIDFIIKLYLDNINILTPPKFINNRRIFHPNLNPITLEFGLLELISWVPSTTVTHLINSLKSTIIEPNDYAIHNNPICKKAAYLYKVDKKNFRTYIIQFCPAVLENICLKQCSKRETEMQEESQKKKYIQISQIVPMTRLSRYEYPLQNDDQLEFLNKRIIKFSIQFEQKSPIQTSPTYRQDFTQEYMNEFY